jgi:cation diffusion facilitator family transporter
MIRFLAHFFIKNPDNTSDPQVRQAYGILCGTVGILLNLLLFGGKYLAGVLTASIAITADAFNNLSDAGSSLITLLGFHLAGQKPDPHHPYGHGRLEYVSGLIVAMMIILVGFELLRSSFEKILNPEEAVMNPVSLGILIAAILIKGYMAFYNRRIGKTIDSAAMKATAADSLSDMLATFAVLVSTLLGYFFQWKIDGWCGLLVSLMILYSGYTAAKDTINPLLGESASTERIQAISEIVLRSPLISGLHDLIIHDYGPGRQMISLHAEVPSDCDIMKAHEEIDRVEDELRATLGCDAVIHMDPIATHDPKTVALRAETAQLARTVHPDITIHDFRTVHGETRTNLIFDAVIPYELPMTDDEIRQRLADTITAELGSTYHCIIHIDKPYV